MKTENLGDQAASGARVACVGPRTALTVTTGHLGRRYWAAQGRRLAGSLRDVPVAAPSRTAGGALVTTVERT